MLAHKRYLGEALRVPIGQASIVELPKAIRRGRLGGLLFETDKTFLLPSAMTGMRNLRRLYEQYGHLGVLVTGHTDTQGSTDYNLGLSVERAESVAAFLTDQVEAWLAWYRGRPFSQRWGAREDQLMLTALGWADLRAFQAGKGLPATGVADEPTRRALVADYMAQDGTSLPAGTPMSIHGCGEHHPAVPTGDNVDEPKNRRVEVFLFEGPVEPPPRAPCQSCPEYPIWVAETVLTVDLDQEPGELRVRTVDDKGAAVPEARVRISGAVVAENTTGVDGTLLFPDLIPGPYHVIAEKEGWQGDRADVVVEPGHPEVLTQRSNLVAGGDSNDDEVTLELVAAAPKITRFEARSVDDKGKASAPGAFVFVPQGHKLQLSWEIEGDADKVTLEPGGRDVTGKTSIELDLRPEPDNPSGTYTLTAQLGSARSAAKTVEVAGIVIFRAEPFVTPFDDKPAKMFDKEGTREIPTILGKNGTYQKAPFNAGNVWFGQVTPRSEVHFEWKILGAALVTIELEAHHHQKEDVTERTRLDPEGRARLLLDYKKRILLEADLRVARDGTRLGGSVLLIRENIPHPGIEKVTLFVNGVPAPSGSKSSWQMTSVGWKLSGDHQQNRLELTVKDAAGTVLRGPEIIRAHDDAKSEGANRPAGDPLGGVLTFELRLINKLGQVADGPKSVVADLEHVPDKIGGVVWVKDQAGEPVADCKVALANLQSNHVATTNRDGKATFAKVPEGTYMINVETKYVSTTRENVPLADGFDEVVKLRGKRVAMRVGFNYPWTHNRYGADFGPNPHQGDAELDAQDKLEAQGKLDQIPLQPWVKTMPGNLKKLKDLGVTVVRMWILGNGFVYGRPTYKQVRSPSGGDTIWSFDPPATVDRRFRRDFEKLLAIFDEAGMKLVPSLLDFHAFHENGPSDARFIPGRRGNLAHDPAKAKIFYDTMLAELLAASQAKKHVIEAWEVMNEPCHITNSIATIFPKPHLPEVSESQMSTFLAEGCKRIEAAGFASTVGHRFFSDLKTFPTGTLRQYHYYAKTVAGMGDPNPIPTFADAKAVLGEFHAAFKSSENEPWPELGSDAKSQTVYQRMRLLLDKGYEEAWVWPDRKDSESDIFSGDALKLSADQQASLKRFATGYFDQGKPPATEPSD